MWKLQRKWKSQKKWNWRKIGRTKSSPKRKTCDILKTFDKKLWTNNANKQNQSYWQKYWKIFAQSKGFLMLIFSFIHQPAMVIKCLFIEMSHQTRKNFSSSEGQLLQQAAFVFRVKESEFLDYNILKKCIINRLKRNHIDWSNC